MPRPKYRHENVLKLSGGQQQRVAIARALASDAQVILADEPTGNLDEDTAAEITSILKNSAHQAGKCVVVVTHANELAKQADIVLRLRKGRLQVIAHDADHNEKIQGQRQADRLPPMQKLLPAAVLTLKSRRLLLAQAAYGQTPPPKPKTSGIPGTFHFSRNP